LASVAAYLSSGRDDCAGGRLVDQQQRSSADFLIVASVASIVLLPAGAPSSPRPHPGEEGWVAVIASIVMTLFWVSINLAHGRDAPAQAQGRD